MHAAIDVAAGAGTLVSLDFNYRAALWSAEEAAAELRDLTGRADLAALGPRHAVVKRGPAGAVAVVDGTPHTVPAVPVRAVDSVGAGDAFVAGYLASLLRECESEACLATAAACGAFAVTVPGDWEGLPTWEELRLLERSSGTVIR